MNKEEIIKLVNTAEKNLESNFKSIDDNSLYYSEKVLNAMQNNHLTEGCFNSTTGYGYSDYGREVIENIYAEIFNAESALVCNQFVSGSHALAKTFFALLRPNDLLLSISGTPYDTLHEVIGIKNNNSSLISFGVKYEEIALKDNDFQDDLIIDYLKNHQVKVIEIQRSKGYSLRESLSIKKLERIINKIKKISPNTIIMVDNCYCEMVEKVNPIQVGADIIVGSLIKNLGGGIAPNGAYVVGRKDLVDLVGESLTLPGEGREVGPTLGINKSILQGLFFAPSVVASSLKTAVLTAYVMEKLGYKVSPRYNEDRVDIVENIIFEDKEKLIKFIQGVQIGSPVDSKSLPIPIETPGYSDPIIMASGSFTQGSSIEFSCDGPIRPPYIAYMQGGLTYEYGRLGLIKAIEFLTK